MSGQKLPRIGTGRPAYHLVRLIALPEARSLGWCVVVEPADSTGFQDALAEELRIQLQASLRIIDAGEYDVPKLLGALGQPRDDIVLVKGLERWRLEDIGSLDARRSALARPGFVIVSLPPRGVDGFFEHAPNLRSWVGGNIFRPEPDAGLMNDSDRRARLEELSKYYGLTDEQVVDKAESGTLPPDPEFAEWLVLIGRGDLAG